MKKTILFIDDDTMLDRLLTRFMEYKSNEFDMVTVNNGAEGLIKAREIKPDLILLDIIMPKENGWEVAEQLRKDPVTKDIPIIVVSGAGSRFDEEPYVEGELIDGYLRKPFDIPELMNQINKVLNKKS